jgi:glycine oxidase
MAPDILIIGGGVVGLTIARRLAQSGRRVALLERGECGREASWAGAGILSPCNPHRTDPLHHLQDRSLAMFEAFCGQLHTETGIDPEYDRLGELQLVTTPDVMPIAQSDARAGADLRMPDGSPVYEMLPPAALRELEPAAASDALGALLCRVTATVRNPRLLAALLASCRAAGVEIREGCPVDDVLIEGGRVTGVIAQGERVAAGGVMLCAGAWSGSIGQRLGALMPVHPVRGQMLLLRTESRAFRHVLGRGKHYLVPRRDGHVLVGSTEEPEAGFAKRNTPEGVAALTAAALRLVPGLADAPLLANWAGLRPGTPDGRPYVGAVPALPGLWAATGHFRAGLTLAPATADVMLHLLDGRAYDIDVSPLRPGR